MVVLFQICDFFLIFDFFCKLTSVHVLPEKEGGTERCIAQQIHFGM